MRDQKQGEGRAYSGSGHCGRFGHVRALIKRHEGVFDSEIVTAGSAHAGGVPGIADRGGRNRDQHHPRFRLTVGQPAGLAVFMDHRPAHQHAGVSAAAGKAPRAAYPVAVVNDIGTLGRPELTGPQRWTCGRTGVGQRTEPERRPESWPQWQSSTPSRPNR